MPVEVGRSPYRKPVTPTVARLFPPFESKASSGIFDGLSSYLWGATHSKILDLLPTIAYSPIRDTGAFTWQA